MGACGPTIPEIMMKKGDLVRLNKNKCFTKSAGGELRFPHTNYYSDENGIICSYRPITEQETREWYDSDASKGMNSAGESKLPPQCVSVNLFRENVYTVLRARCRVRLGWGNPATGMCKIMCSETGEITYVKRDLVEVVSCL